MNSSIASPDPRTTSPANPVDAYASAFERFEAAQASVSPAWLTPTRKAALAHFAALGFPTTRHEDWRFTSLRELTASPFRVGSPAKGGAVRLSDFQDCLLPEGDVACRLVFVNGAFAPELSIKGDLPAGVHVSSLAEAMRTRPELLQRHLARHADYRDRALAALNTAFIADGALVHLERGRILERPIELVHLGAPTTDRAAAFTRCVVLAEEGAQATIVETWTGRSDGVLFANHVAEFIAEDNAHLDHYVVQRHPENAFHYSLHRLHCGRSASIRSHSLNIGARLARNEVHAVLAGEGGDCTLNGLYLSRGTQHVDNALRVEHASPHCHSWEYYKGVLDDRSHAVFTGRIFVHHGAQKTDAKQTNMNLLLSDAAGVDTKPQLEIFADDVKCTHGATIGQLDADAIFYLRSRGLPAPAARTLLTYAFAAESLEAIRVPALRREMHRVLLGRLPQGELLRELT